MPTTVTPDPASTARPVRGQRFQARYWRHRERRHERGWFVRIASLCLGSVLAVAGLAMLVLPGPGILALALAGALFATESLRLARGLDWIEMRGAALWRRWRERRRKPSGTP
jgi:hypothetical protein